MRKFLQITAVIFAFCVAAFPQAALVQSAATAASSPVSLTISATTSSHLILVLVTGPGSSATVTSITDNATGGSNSYHQVTSARGSVASTENSFSDLWYAENINPGATSITVTSSGASFILVEAFEFSGMVTSGSPDGSGANVSNATASGTSALGASLTTSTSDVLYCGGDLSGLSAVSSGWTIDGDGDGAYMLNSVVGTLQPTFTVTSGTPYEASCAAFKVASSMAPPSNLMILGVGL